MTYQEYLGKISQRLLIKMSTYLLGKATCSVILRNPGPHGAIDIVARYHTTIVIIHRDEAYFKTLDDPGSEAIMTVYEVVRNEVLPTMKEMRGL